MNPLTPTEDIRAARHKLAAKFDNNLDQIVADLLRQHNAHINNVLVTLFEGRYGNDWLIISKQGELLGSIQNHEYN